MRKREQGFTLPEIMIGIAVTGAIVAVIAMAAIQFTTVGNEGTTKLSFLDKAQNASRWFVRDAQNAYVADTGACAANCNSITFNFCDMSAIPTFLYTADPADPFGGTITCAQSGTVTYWTRPELNDNDLHWVRETPSGGHSGTVTIARDVTVEFSVINLPGTKQMVTMAILLPADDPIISKTYSAYLRASRGGS